MQINKVFLSGNLTADPDIRNTASGEKVANFTIANNRKYTSQGEKRESVAFIAIVAWGPHAEVAQKYLKKGTLVVIEGRLDQDRWEDEEGHKKSKTKVSVVNINLVPRAVQSQEVAA
jgi:single-strand DNA-binding protein